MGSLGIYLTARKPPWDGSRMGWDGGRFYQECLPSPPVGWIRLNVLGVVGQRKLFSVVTGNRNMSKVVLDWAGAKAARLEFASQQ